MSNFNLKESIPGNPCPESMQLTSNGVKGNFTCYTGIQGDYWISITPSINVTGYGLTEEEARACLKENFDFFSQSLFQLNPKQRVLELKKLGWIVDRFFKKRFSKSYVVDNGVLQGFDHPEQVKKSDLEVA